MGHYLTRTDDRLRKFSINALLQEVDRRARGSYALASTLGEESDIAEIVADVRSLLVSLEEIASHAHKWTEQDYCEVCGADGRA